MKFRLLLTHLALAALTSTAALAGPVITGGAEVGIASINSFGASFMHGYEFSLTTGQSLTALGFWDSGSDGLVGSYQVGLWQNDTQALLASAFIDNTDALDGSVTVSGGQWRYETLGSPVALSTTKVYTLAWFGAVSAPDALTITYSTLTSAPGVTVWNNIRYLSTPTFTFPTNVGGALPETGPRSNVSALLVPEPGSALLLAMVGAGLLLRRRRGA